MNYAYVKKVYDGDTITCDIYHETTFNLLLTRTNVSVRIYGIDTPELRDPILEIKTLAYEVRDYLRKMILHKEVKLILIEDRDKYGRALAYVSTIDGIDISEHLLEMGYAKEYYGGTKDKWRY